MPYKIREWTGDMVISDDLDRGWSSAETGLLGFDVDAHQVSDQLAGGTDTGLFKATVLQRLQVPAAIAPSARLRIRVDCTIDTFEHTMKRWPVPPLPHAATMVWRTEFHIHLPDGGEILKMPVAERSLNGTTRYDRRVDIVAPGTTKTFSAVTSARYVLSQPFLLRFGLWTEFRVSTRQMRMKTFGKVRLRVTSVTVCPSN